MITIGTPRGIPQAKTENSSFNTFVVPAINLSDLIDKDAVISLIKLHKLTSPNNQNQITRAANTPDNEIIDQAPNAGFSVVSRRKA